MTHMGDNSSYMNPPVNEYPNYVYKHERWYHVSGKYMFPIDEQEKDRLDIFHKLFLVARNNALHAAPLSDDPVKETSILDLGCGTGIWAIDMAERYRNSHVVGLDLSMIQPEEIPPRVRFAQSDLEASWGGLPRSYFDLVHIRAMYGAIQNWHNVYSSAWHALKPGAFLEQVEIDWTFLDGDLGHGAPVSNQIIRDWNNEWMDAMDRCGRSMTVARVGTKNLLLNAGFDNIREDVIPIPCNGWPEDPEAKTLGRWFHLGLTQGIDALTLSPMCSMLRRREEDVRLINERVKREISSRATRAYCNLHIWTAMRPPLS